MVTEWDGGSKKALGRHLCTMEAAGVDLAIIYVKGNDPRLVVEVGKVITPMR